MIAPDGAGAMIPGVFGVVLAGGRSTRFGAEKAVTLVGGSPILARVYAVLTRGCAEVAINAPEAAQAARLAAQWGAARLSDPAGASAGPLAGVLAGLRWARDNDAWALVTSPCDTPSLPDDLVARLAEALARGGEAAVARTPSGLQPLCALWRVSTYATLAAALEGGAHPPVREVLHALAATAVDFAEASAFANLNTREDVAALSPVVLGA